MRRAARRALGAGHVSRSGAGLSSVPARHHDGAHVVCGVNGSTGSRRALVEAVRLAAGLAGHVRAVAAYQPHAYFWGAWTWLPWAAWLPVPDDPETEAAEQRAARVVVDEVLRTLPATDVVPPVEVLAAPGRTADVLLGQADGASMLVVGHRDPAEAVPWTGGPGLLSAPNLPASLLLSGSVALECVRRARCPVLVVPRARGGGRADGEREAFGAARP